MEIIIKNWQVLEMLGEGSFSIVYKVKSQKTQKVYALKQLKSRYRCADEVNHLPEVTVLLAMRGHPNIITLYDVLYDPTTQYAVLIFELMDMNLYEFMKFNKKPFTEKEALLIVYQLLNGLSYLHSHGIFHRDIKPENCMINKKTFEVKICDFGSASQSSAKSVFTQYVATRWYRAPECILTAGSYSSPVDIWAVGCILFELMSGRPLFPGKHEIDQITKINNVLEHLRRT